MSDTPPTSSAHGVLECTSDAVAAALWLDDLTPTNRQSMQVEVGDWEEVQAALAMDDEELQSLDLQCQHDRKMERLRNQLACGVADPPVSYDRLRLRTKQAYFDTTLHVDDPEVRRAARQRVAATRKRKRVRVLLRPTKRTIPLDENEWLSFNTY